MTTKNEETAGAEVAVAPGGDADPRVAASIDSVNAAAEQLRELALIMRHVGKLSQGSKIWLRDRLDSELEL